MEIKKSALQHRIHEEMKVAMKAQDKLRLATIRLIHAALKQREVDERMELSDADVIAILNKMLKQRRDSISQYQAGGRQDLAAQEAFELAIIQAYLPAQLSATEIAELINEAMVVNNAKTAADMGKVMATLKPQLQGRADLSIVSQQVKSKLS